MPTLLIERGFKFFFYANEHEPRHVHVMKGARHARINLETLDFISCTLSPADRRAALGITRRETANFAAARDAFFAER